MAELEIPVTVADELDGGPLLEPIEVEQSPATAHGTEQGTQSHVSNLTPHSNGNDPLQEKGDGVVAHSELCDALDSSVKQFGSELTQSQKATISKLSAGATRDIRMVARAISGAWPLSPQMREVLTRILFNIVVKGQKRVARRRLDGTETLEYENVSDRTYTTAINALVKMGATNTSLLPQIHQIEMSAAPEQQQGDQLDLSKLTDDELNALHAMYQRQGAGK